MKKLVRPFVDFCLDIFLFFFRRSKRIVVCSGWFGQRFADNSRYIFLYLNENKEAANLEKIIWLTSHPQIKRELREAGYTVYMKNSIVGIYYHLRSFYFFYDQFSLDYFTFLTRGAKLIGLWHGMPIKKFGVWNGLDWNLKDEYLLTCSDWGDTTIGGAFRVKPDHLLHGMYPRNYYLNQAIPYLTTEEVSLLAIVKKEKEKGKKILFYLPTFRKSKLQFLGEADPAKIKDFFHFLSTHQYFLVTKIHYAGYSNHQDSVCYTDKDLLNLSPMADIYPFLKETDILITDYSSVLFDFLYLDRDVICYPYDLQAYRNKDQGLLVDYQTLPANIVYTLDELTEDLLQKMEGRDAHGPARRSWLRKCFGEATITDTINNSLQA